MEQKLKEAWKELKDLLRTIPIKQNKTFTIEAVNGGNISYHHVLGNDLFQMEDLRLGTNVETRWMFHNKDINFMVIMGMVDLHFRLNDNIHIKHLRRNQTIRIIAGIPFMLKTYEEDSNVLLISTKEPSNE